MWSESEENDKKQALRSGYTTGAYATACISMAARLLFNLPVSYLSNIRLPQKKIDLDWEPVSLPIRECYKFNSSVAYCSSIKNAGDDPDITHGAIVFVILRLCDLPQKTSLVTFSAGLGVGTVTKKGLSLTIGEPAINPVPRQMIVRHLLEISKRVSYTKGFHVTIGIENGQALAKKTMNEKLGIYGGLSILGTTGKVRPFSCSAWIASIHQSIDVALANKIPRLFACTGNISERFAQQRYPQYFHKFDLMPIIEMGDLVGAVIKHIKSLPLQRLTVVGGFGKITKLANGHLNLHSNASSIDFVALSLMAKKLGASDSLLKSIRIANTSIEVLKECQANNIPLGNEICLQAWSVVKAQLTHSIKVDIFALDRSGKMVGYYSD